MKLETGWVRVGTGARAFTAYRVRPAAADGPQPAVLVIQEAWGVDVHIQDMAERLATAGYLTLAPDLYSVGDRRPELAPERVAAVKEFLETVPPAVWSDPAAREQALSELPVDGRERIWARWPCCSAGSTRDSTSRRWTMRSARCATTRRATVISERSAGAWAAACRRGSRAASRASTPP